jgi:hypothetical protein
VGATLDETRVELEAQRTRVRGTADRLETATRRSLDVRAIIGRHPGRTIGVAAGAAFLLLGGPQRTVRLVRRSLGGAADREKAYAALPPSLRAFVDSSAPGFGSAKAEARGELALALHAWRENPKNRKKAQKLVSETLTPPGPSRAFWSLVEVAAVTAAGIIAKQVVARQVAGGVTGALFGSRRKGATVEQARGSVEPAAAPAPKSTDATSSKPATRSSASGSNGYSGWSGRRASVAGPARESQEPSTTKR